jgi:hypothetical protein
MPRVGIAVIVALAMAGGACAPSADPPDIDGGGDGDRDGGPDGGDGGDAGGATAGLGLDFGSDPPLPGDLVGGAFAVHVDEARFELYNLRALGDSATGVGTTQPTLELRWGDDDGDEEEPSDEGDIRVFFPNAPPGYYSHINADIAEYRVRGTVEVDSTVRRFEIDDRPPTSLDVSIALDDFELLASTTRTISLLLELHGPVGHVAWDQVPIKGGDELRVEEDSDQIGGVRDRLRAAFSVAGTGEAE